MPPTNATANAIYLYAPLAAVVLVSVALNPTFCLLGLALLYANGLTMLVKSKSSLFRQHKLITFGPGKLNAENRGCYYRAYMSIGCGVFLNVLALLLNVA